MFARLKRSFVRGQIRGRTFGKGPARAGGLGSVNGCDSECCSADL